MSDFLFLGDLDKVVAAIDLLLKNHRNDYLIAWEEAKIQEPKRCKRTLFRHLRYQVTPYAIRQIQGHIEQVIKVIEIGNNEPLPPYIKSFQTTMELLYAHHLKKLIKDNHAIELKYIQWHWRFVRPINWKTQVIEYAPNREIPPAIQQYLLEPQLQSIQGGTSNDANIPSRGAFSLPQPQVPNA